MDSSWCPHILLSWTDSISYPTPLTMYRQGVSLRPYFVSLGSLDPTLGQSTPTTPFPAFSYSTTITPHTTTSLFLNHPAGGGHFDSHYVELPWTAAASPLAPPVPDSSWPALLNLPTVPTVPAVHRVPTVPAVPTVPSVPDVEQGVPSLLPTAVPIFKR